VRWWEAEKKRKGVVHGLMGCTLNKIQFGYGMKLIKTGAVFACIPMFLKRGGRDRIRIFVEEDCNAI